MNKKQNLIKLHLITGETVETVEEVISHERSDIISQYENPSSKTMKIAVKDGNNLGIATIPIEHILYIDVIFLKEDELRDYMEASSSMEIKINKEIRSYTESIFFGLSVRQFIYSILACAVAVLIYFSSINIFGMEITSWLCILGATPFAAIGFISYQSMTMEKIIYEAFRSLLLKKTKLIDKPFNLYYELAKPIIRKQIKENTKRNVKKSKQIQTSK